MSVPSSTRTQVTLGRPRARGRAAHVERRRSPSGWVPAVHRTGRDSVAAPPPHTASTASLTVAPGTASRMVLNSSTVKRRVSKTRCGDTAALKRVAGNALGTQQHVAGQRQRRRRGPAQRAAPAAPPAATPRPGCARCRRQHGHGAWRVSGNHGVGRRGGPPASKVVQQLVISLPLSTSIAAWCDLGQQREAARRQFEEAVQALDDIDLPQRPVQVERPGVDARGLDAELPPVARLGQRDVADVVFEVEVLVLDPVRMVEVERHAQQLLAEHRQRSSRLSMCARMLLKRTLPPGAVDWL